jgi:hypothetical protein
MRQKSLLRGSAIAVDRRKDGQILIGLDGLDQTPDLRRQRGEGRHVGASPIDACRDFDDRVVGEVRQRSVVPHVDDLDVAGAGMERGHQLGRSLAVERTAALLEQLRLLVDRRVPV